MGIYGVQHRHSDTFKNAIKLFSAMDLAEGAHHALAHLGVSTVGTSAKVHFLRSPKIL